MGDAIEIGAAMMDSNEVSHFSQGLVVDMIVKSWNFTFPYAIVHPLYMTRLILCLE